MSSETSTDRPGGNYASFITADFRVCALACAQDPDCRAYSHYDLAPGICNLKDMVPPATSSSYARSGVKP